jgi:hypothetical protein
MNRTKSAINCWALLVALSITAGSLNSSLTQMGVADGYLISSNGGVPSIDAVVHASGEVRIVIANLLWMKVIDHYHHQFLAKGGAWSKNSALMPYLRMIVWLDPHFIEAYEVGGSILSGTGRYKECDAFLDSGTRNNLDSWQLYYDRAMLRAWYLKNPTAALPFAEHALQCAKDPFTHNRIQKFCKTLEQTSVKNRANHLQSTVRTQSASLTSRPRPA